MVGVTSGKREEEKMRTLVGKLGCVGEWKLMVVIIGAPTKYEVIIARFRIQCHSSLLSALTLVQLPVSLSEG